MLRASVLIKRNYAVLKTSMLCREQICCVLSKWILLGERTLCSRQVSCVLSKNVVVRACTLCGDQVYCLLANTLCWQLERGVQTIFCVLNKYTVPKTSFLHWKQVFCIWSKSAVLRTRVLQVRCAGSEYALFNVSMLSCFEQESVIGSMYAVSKACVLCYERYFVFPARMLCLKQVRNVGCIYAHSVQSKYAVFWNFTLCPKQEYCVLSQYVMLSCCAMHLEKLRCVESKCAVLWVSSLCWEHVHSVESSRNGTLRHSINSFNKPLWNAIPTSFKKLLYILGYMFSAYQVFFDIQCILLKRNKFSFFSMLHECHFTQTIEQFICRTIQNQWKPDYIFCPDKICYIVPL